MEPVQSGIRSTLALATYFILIPTELQLSPDIDLGTNSDWGQGNKPLVLVVSYLSIELSALS